MAGPEREDAAGAAAVGGGGHVAEARAVRGAETIGRVAGAAAQRPYKVCPADGWPGRASQAARSAAERRAGPPRYSGASREA